MATRYVSMVDLLSIPEMKEIIMNADKPAFMKAMWDSGFDTVYGLMYQVCWHRPFFSNIPIYTGRFVSEERSDANWVNSEHCSLEKRLEHYGKYDPELQKDLVALSAMPNFTSMFIEHVKRQPYGDETELYYKGKQNERYIS